jgi:hypothetical protein
LHALGILSSTKSLCSISFVLYSFTLFLHCISAHSVGDRLLMRSSITLTIGHKEAYSWRGNLMLS